MKTWLITGCSSGIGKGIAKAVLQQGDNAVITARNVDSVADLAKEYPQTALAVRLDITDRTSIKEAVAAATAHFGGIDLLINNAGYGYRAAVEEGDDEGVAKVFQTNFFGPIDLIKEALPQMRQRKNGVIVNVSSIAAARSGVGSGYYASSKAALELMSDALRKELAPLGIKVMVVEPGSFRTRFYDDSLQGTPIRIDDYKDTAGKTRKENVVNLHQQPGDPEKGGAMIVKVAQMEELPKTLLLGSDAVAAVSGEYQSRLAEIETWKDLSVQTDF